MEEHNGAGADLARSYESCQMGKFHKNSRKQQDYSRNQG